MPLVLPISGAPSYAVATPLTIDATGEMAAFVGRMSNPTRATKDVRKVHFRFGTVTKAGGSALTVSLQTVNAAVGPPYQPDETQDQTVAIANADAGFVSNTWYTTGALSADRTVAYGEMLAVVIEYDGGGRLGADTVGISALGGSTAHVTMSEGGCALKTASWAAASGWNNVVLEFSDGTFGTLEQSVLASAVNTHSFNSGSTPDEHALAFTVPLACKVDGIFAHLAIQAGADVDLVLYQGTSALATGSIDANAIRSAAGAAFFTPIAEQTLTASTQYYVAVKPTTTTSVSAYSLDVSAVGHMALNDGGTNFNYSTRTDAGSWAAVTTTRRLVAGIRISSVDDGNGSGSAVKWY
jgi:hypothetical protein